jgi:hypothetical protein
MTPGAFHLRGDAGERSSCTSLDHVVAAEIRIHVRRG